MNPNLESFGGQFWSLFSYVNRETDDKKVFPVFELRIGATVERENVNAKAELFFFALMKREGKRTIVNIVTLGLEWITCIKQCYPVFNSFRHFVLSL
jgi:hypothetical protein